ncbi:hypothetical protein CEXT_320701 [Caerostris extrusa]|uniref:Uncharacterized protein n=1 Tax=Caerostris extrusa TaxID=172846 RepID=A0AAV4V4X0_CAEEX|nr:hypothetical protein CEXT_320701 [Caerostris extrusa]
MNKILSKHNFKPNTSSWTHGWIFFSGKYLWRSNLFNHWLTTVKLGPLPAYCLLGKLFHEKERKTAAQKKKSEARGKSLCRMSPQCTPITL